jgi:hypothetical protein
VPHAALSPMNMLPYASLKVLNYVCILICMHISIENISASCFYVAHEHACAEEEIVRKHNRGYVMCGNLHTHYIVYELYNTCMSTSSHPCPCVLRKKNETVLLDRNGFC